MARKPGIGVGCDLVGWDQRCDVLGQEVLTEGEPSFAKVARYFPPMFRTRYAPAEFSALELQPGNHLVETWTGSRTTAQHGRAGADTSLHTNLAACLCHGHFIARYHQ